MRRHKKLVASLLAAVIAYTPAHADEEETDESGKNCIQSRSIRRTASAWHMRSSAQMAPGLRSPGPTET